MGAVDVVDMLSPIRKASHAISNPISKGTLFFEHQRVIHYIHHFRDSG